MMTKRMDSPNERQALEGEEGERALANAFAAALYNKKPTRRRSKIVARIRSVSDKDHTYSVTLKQGIGDTGWRLQQLIKQYGADRIVTVSRVDILDFDTRELAKRSEQNRQDW